MNLNFKQQSDLSFLIAAFFINVVGVMLIISALSFAVKVPVTAIHFPLAVIIALAINYYVSKSTYFLNNNKAFLKSVLLITVLFVAAYLLAIYFYDVSIDGQTYHQATIIQLKNGWNPFYEELPAHTDYSILLNHYGKGAEIPQAVVYAFFNKIEAGKVTNIFLLIGSFFLTVSFLYKLNKFTTFKIYLISALLTLNPVVIVQLFSYFIDGQLALMLQCMFILSCYTLLESDKFKFFLLSIVIIIAINIKFTAIPYVGIFIAGTLCTLLFRKNIKAFKNVLFTAGVSSIIALVLIGFNPYITNVIHHQNPFYPLAGKGKIDIMTINSPIGFPQKNRFENFFTSYFSHTDNMLFPQKNTPKLKIPFTFKMSEMRFSYEEDTRIGGFGVLFSGIMLLGLILLITTFKELSKPTVYLFVFALITVLLSVFTIEYTWWARYVPQLWFLIFIILAFSESTTARHIKWFRNITYFVITLNIFLLGVVSVFKNLVATQKTKYQLRQLTTLHDTAAVDFGLFKPSRLKFIENHIPFKEQHLDSTANFIMKYIHANVNLKIIPANLPEPFLFKLDEKLKGKTH